MKPKTNRKKTDYTIVRTLALAGIATLAVFIVVQKLSAGPITKNPDGSPFSKLSVYQGVISIVPGGATDSVMEIGNAGRDIASTGDMYIRPGGLDSDTSKYAKFFNDGGKVSLTIPGTIQTGPQDATSLGGEIILQPSQGLYRQWHIGVNSNLFRIYHTPRSGTDDDFAIDSNNGYIWVASPSGKLCFFGSDCHTWNDFAASGGSLDSTLSGGNKSDKDIVLGQGTNATYQAGVALLDITQTDGGKDAISGKQNTAGNTKAGIYGENTSASGWAGYFTGRVNVTSEICFNGANCRTGWSAPTLQNVLLAGNTAPNLHASINGPTSVSPSAAFVATMGAYGTGLAGNPLDSIAAYNKVAGGSAIYAEAEQGTTAAAGYLQGRSKVVNNNTNAALYGSALIAVGGSQGVGNSSYNTYYGINGPAAVETWRTNFSSAVGAPTYAIFAGAGSNASGGTNYAGYFIGRTAFTAGLSGQPALKLLKGGLDVVSVYVQLWSSGATCNAQCASTGQTCINATYSQIALDPLDTTILDLQFKCTGIPNQVVPPSPVMVRYDFFRCFCY